MRASGFRPHERYYVTSSSRSLIGEVVPVRKRRTRTSYIQTRSVERVSSCDGTAIIDTSIVSSTPHRACDIVSGVTEIWAGREDRQSVARNREYKDESKAITMVVSWEVKVSVADEEKCRHTCSFLLTCLSCAIIDRTTAGIHLSTGPHFC